MAPSLVFIAQEAPPLSFDVRLPLSIMHLLEFAIWGAWWVVLANYLNTLKFSRTDIGRIYATMAVGSIIAPMFVGGIADKYFAAEYVFGALHILGGILLFTLAKIDRPRPFYWVTFLYALAYAPTLHVVNSLTFANIPDPERDFPWIRVFGTIGWILAGLSLKFFIRPGQPVNNRPILLAGTLSLVLGVFSLFVIPHTPPEGEAELPFAGALGMLLDPASGVFFFVSFLIAIGLAFYFSFTALFLEQDTKVRAQNVGPLMTIGQLVEIGFMLSLPWFIEALGMNWVLGLGMAAWALRYAFFASRGPFGLILLGIALHGVCFDFFFAAGFIHVENMADEGIRNSAQSLFGVITYGVGMYIGTEASGWLNQRLTRETVDERTGETVLRTDWTRFWLAPGVGILIGLIVFLLFG